MLSGNCTEALSIQANVTISGSSAKLIKNGIAPLPFPPRAAKAILVHKARGEGQGQGTCSILSNVRVNEAEVFVALKIASSALAFLNTPWHLCEISRQTQVQWQKHTFAPPASAI